MDPLESKVVFRPFDPAADLQISERNLPHWFQPDAAIFVTVRTQDSLPHEVIERWRRELEEWLRIRNLPLALAQSVAGLLQPEHDARLVLLSHQQRNEFRRFSDLLFHHALDECHGECVLRRSDLAEVVASAIQYGNHQRYDLDSFVIMPNHFHVIVQFRPGATLSIVSQSWMRFTAREINRRIGRSGPFWQPEPFDHLIRSPEQFAYLHRYIAENPRKANLAPTEFLHWTRESA